MAHSHNDNLFNQPATFKLASRSGSNFAVETDNSFHSGTGAQSSGTSFSEGLSNAEASGALELIAEGITDITTAGAKKVQARNIEFAARQEEIKGTQIAGNFLDKLNNIQASNIVIAFAQGRQLTGSVVSIRQELGLKAARATRIVKLDQRLKTLALERQAKYLRAVAKWQKVVGPIKIVAGVALAWATYGG